MEATEAEGCSGSLTARLANEQSPAECAGVFVWRSQISSTNPFL